MADSHWLNAAVRSGVNAAVRSGRHVRIELNQKNTISVIMTNPWSNV
jgi:hypothetical protein